MKKPLRLIAALLAICVAAATFPPVGLAAENDLRTLIDQADPDGVVDLGGQLILANDVSVGGASLLASFVIDKPITIQNGRVTVRAGGIVLGADTTFSNVEFSFPSATEGGNFIAANGYTLTLENVTCLSTSESFNLFCGAFTGNSHPTVSLPPSGTEGTILIKENVSIQGQSSSGNIYAGNVYRTRDGNGSPDKIFQGNASISVLASKNNLGTVYGCGATADGSVTQMDETYTVSGTVCIAGNAPDVHGTGADVIDVIYQGSGNQARKTFSDISSLAVESGNLVLENGSWFRNNGALSLSSGTKLDLRAFQLTNLDIDSFDSSDGFLFLGENQTWHIGGQVSGTAKVVIGSLSSDGENSMTQPSDGHTYIQAPGSQDGNFVLLPYANSPNMTLVRDDSGNWTASSGSSGGDENRVQDFSFDTAEVSAGPGEEAEFPLTVDSSTGGPLYLDYIPLDITINNRQANRSAEVIDGETCYKYADRYGYLSSLEIYGNSLYVTSDAEYGAVDSPYTIGITVPAAYTADNRSITKTAVLNVSDSGTTDPGSKTISVPKANAGLKWTGVEQTGVNAGTGYTLSGDFKATDVGSYTAIAALEPGYQWTGGSTDPQTISWSIARANGPAVPAGLAGVAPTAAGGADGKITGTTSAMEYAADSSFTNPQNCGDGETGGLSTGTYYVRIKETATHEAGASTPITVPAAGQQPGGTKHQATVSNTGDGGTNSGIHMYEEGVEVIIHAGSKSGHTFAAWEATGITLANPGVPEISFTMPANDVTLHASWTPDSVTPPDGHTHAWSTAWQSDETHHWHNCTASGCPITQDSQKSGYAAHTAGNWVVDRPAASSQSGSRHRSCTVCGYEMIRETIPATGGSSTGGSSSSGGGSSTGGSSSGSTTVKNPDGSTISTSTNKTTGTVTETTKRPDGSKTVVETTKNGTVTTTDTAKDGSTVKTVARPDGSTETTIKQASGLTASIQEHQNSAEADVRIPSKMLAENPGNSVALPIPTLPGEDAFVTVHTGSARPVSVEIPVHGNDNTTVACLVNPDGSETILKTAILFGGQMTVSVSNGTTVHIRDNGKAFQDTRGHWAGSAINFVSARELFSGKTSSTFAPDASMSRAMLMTVLARLDGVDTAGASAYEKGMTWAVARGISDGRNPDSQVNREQFVVMLHRYAGSPAATDRELHFSDTEKIGAYAQEAVRWAMENGILSGYGDGSLLLNGKTTRAQAAAMLERYIKYLNRQ